MTKTLLVTPTIVVVLLVAVPSAMAYTQDYYDKGYFFGHADALNNHVFDNTWPKIHTAETCWKFLLGYRDGWIDELIATHTT